MNPAMQMSKAQILAQARMAKAKLEKRMEITRKCVEILTKTTETAQNITAGGGSLGSGGNEVLGTMLLANMMVNRFQLELAKSLEEEEMKELDAVIKRAESPIHPAGGMSLPPKQS